MTQIIISKANDRVVVADAMAYFDALPFASREYIVAYGLTQSLNDAAASVKADSDNAAETAWALVEKRKAKLDAGTVNVRESGGRTADPVRAKAIDLAMKDAKRTAPKGEDPKALRRRALEAVDRWMEKAAKIVEMEAAILAEESADIDAAVEGLEPVTE